MQEEFLGELRQKTTSVTIGEFGPEGVRFSENLRGEMKGLYNATHLETTVALFKPDGTIETDTRAVEMTTEGDVILIQLRGMMKMTPPVSRSESKGTFQTASKKLAWLNSAKARYEGTADESMDEGTWKVFAQR